MSIVREEEELDQKQIDMGQSKKLLQNEAANPVTEKKV